MHELNKPPVKLPRVNAPDREMKEMVSLFDDPRFSRKAWQAFGQAVVKRKAAKPLPRYDKNGDETFESMIERYTYESLCKDLISVGRNEPTELEMILSCQAQMARFNAANFVAFRDTVGAKPVDESKVDQTIYNEYAALTDEELELLAKHRAQKAVDDTMPAIVEADEERRAARMQEYMTPVQRAMAAKEAHEDDPDSDIDQYCDKNE